MEGKNLLLDLTTIITYISDICCDPNIENRFANLTVWNHKNKDIYKQIIDERENPVYSKLEKIINENNIFTTVLTKNKLEEIIISLGSEMEKQNMNKLLDKIKIVPDNPSNRIMNLSGKYWSKLNKNSFGTADKLGYTIVTGNIRALTFLINEENYKIDYVAHRTRCFVGKKYAQKFEK